MRKRKETQSNTVRKSARLHSRFPYFYWDYGHLCRFLGETKARKGGPAHCTPPHSTCRPGTCAAGMLSGLRQHIRSLSHTHIHTHTHTHTRIRTHERNFTYNINICITSAEGSFRACISHLSPALSVPMQLLRSPAVNARVVDRSVNNDAWLEIACNGVFHCVQTGSKVEHRGAENCIRCDKSWRTFLVYVCLHPS